VDRLAGSRGFCGETGALRIASAGIHRGEEPPITGSGGSGTIFVTGCNLRCRFCQNWQISRAGLGREVGEAELVRICLALQEAGAENINLVTGSHAAPALVSGVRAARGQGLAIPVLWNSSAYESPGTLDLLKDTVDVYLPDLKTLDPALSASLFHAPDYPETAQAAILRMLEFRPLRYSPAGVLVSGVIIRHLVLPGRLDATREVLRWFARHARGRAVLSLMTQYTPVPAPEGLPPEPPELRAPDRFVSKEEYGTLLAWLEDPEIGEGFYQELVRDRNRNRLPDFTRPNPFPPELSTPLREFQGGL
jgi:putative pyruvate formate lyase activating enzyme